MIKQQFNDLLTKEMDRKDFLKYSGGVLLAAVGVTGMVKMLLSQGGVSLPTQTQPVQFKQSAMGYGGSAYGR
jgi:hypothetical protein